MFRLSDILYKMKRSCWLTVGLFYHFPGGMRLIAVFQPGEGNCFQRYMVSGKECFHVEFIEEYWLSSLQVAENCF